MLFQEASTQAQYSFHKFQMQALICSSTINFRTFSTLVTLVWVEIFVFQKFATFTEENSKSQHPNRNYQNSLPMCNGLVHTEELSVEDSFEKSNKNWQGNNWLLWFKWVK